MKHIIWNILYETYYMKYNYMKHIIWNILYETYYMKHIVWNIIIWNILYETYWIRTQKTTQEHRTERNTNTFLTPEHRTEQNMKQNSTLEHRTEQNTQEKNPRTRTELEHGNFTVLSSLVSIAYVIVFRVVWHRYP